MARKRRKKSKSGIYHIIMRGINRQTIFVDREDYSRFINTLKKYKEVCRYELYAYCLMGNHIHLLMKEGEEPLEQIMRRICGSYVYWYNRKYERIGNLFQDRYASEPVEDDAYFLTVIRYIFQNPVKAELILNIGEYKWSNYNEYVNKSEMTDIDFALDMFSTNREKAVRRFIEHVEKPSEDNCLDIQKKYKTTDAEAASIIKNLCDIKRATDLQKCDKQERNKYLGRLKKEHTLSIRQLERITGINRGIIERA